MPRQHPIVRPAHAAEADAGKSGSTHWATRGLTDRLVMSNAVKLKRLCG